MEGNKEGNEKKFFSHSVPMILRYERKQDNNGENKDKILQRHHQGAKSAFKEVRKRKPRFNPIEKDGGGPTDTSGARLVTPRLLTNPYTSFQAAYGVAGADMSSLASIQRHMYHAYGRPIVGEPRRPSALGVTFPYYGTLPFFPHPPRPAIYVRDPFVLAAQNCCAKCGVQFRMTSDLVYHMRTHHKHELAAEDEESRERSKPAEKYKCTVCQESFKEKHHLSRHMTSHDS